MVGYNKVFTTFHGDVYFNRNNKELDLVIIDNQTKQISKLELDSRAKLEPILKTVTTENLLRAFYPSTVKLSDGSFKLYVQSKGLGGMDPGNQAQMELLRLPDGKLSARVKDRLPKGTFTAISVYTIEHCFDLEIEGEPITTRLIKLDVEKSDYFVNFFRSLFAGIGLIKDSAYENALNATEAQNQLVEHVFGTPKKCDEIEKAYLNCKKMFLYIAQDGSRVDLTIQDSQMTRTTFRIGQLIREVSVPVIEAGVTIATTLVVAALSSGGN